ncbi:hypothetical protein [Actinokineospora enzanensis]|uniref:hypothetical protein n=1 Tax=Actinokineospora enzanensis TaxID=155975 RepID=UPI00037C51B9|nr:hypothetical protein [Actinokineospora enzanensis]
MTQDHGGYNPQMPQYPQQPQGYPQGGYPQAGGFPAAPQAAPGAGPHVRPGSVTSSAVLGFIQAGITAIITLIMLFGTLNVSERTDGEAGGFGYVLIIVQLVGAVLLIMGGMQLIKGTGRGLMIGGAILEIVIGLFYIVVFAAIPSLGIAEVSSAKGVMIVGALALSVMPVISLIQAAGSGASAWLRRY